VQLHVHYRKDRYYKNHSPRC